MDSVCAIVIVSLLSATCCAGLCSICYQPQNKVRQIIPRLQPPTYQASELLHASQPQASQPQASQPQASQPQASQPQASQPQTEPPAYHVPHIEPPPIYQVPPAYE